MFEWLASPALATVTAMIGVVAAFVIYFLQRSRKALSYEVIAQTKLLSVQEEVKGHLHIFFDDAKVEDLYLVVLKIFNSGNTPIHSSDFQKPVSFSFGKGATLLNAEVMRTVPYGIETSIYPNEAYVDGAETITLAPLLLNKGDEIELKMLLTGYRGNIIVDGRIVGVKEVTQYNRPSHNSPFLAQVAKLLIGGAFLSLLSIGYQYPTAELASYFFVAVMLVAILFFVYLFWIDYRNRRV